MSRQHPSRSTIAETARDRLPVQCPNKNCPETLTYGTVNSHAAKECLFRICKCKFEKIGCTAEVVAS
eukprot:Pgem_evm1s12836